jgi:sialic acid synthase SpsE
MLTRVILELGCNHQGSVEVAKQMIDDAQRLGVWGVKIQKRHPESIPEEQKNLPRHAKDSFGETYYEHRKALEFSVEQVMELKAYAEAKKLAFVVSVFDAQSAKDMVERALVKYVKLPSQFLLDYNLNMYLILNKVEYCLMLIHSTGMHTVQEVLNCPFLNRFDVTLYCRSIYPCTFEQVDLGAARAIFDQLVCPAARGYSSHDKDGAAIPWMVALGARWVERHYTLDKTMKGSDHKTVSSNFEDVQRIMTDIADTEDLFVVKNATSLASEAEIKNRLFYRGKAE